MTKSKIIHENDNYIVMYTDDTYQVINKYSKVVEREDAVWPSAIEAAKFFDQSIKDIEAESLKAKVIPILN